MARLTSAQREELLETSIAYIKSGQKLWEISDYLEKSGCSPIECETLLEKAQATVRTQERKMGIGLLILGGLTLLISYGLMSASEAAAASTGARTYFAPLGGFLLGAYCCLKGSLKTLFG